MFKAEYFFPRILFPFIIGIGIFYYLGSSRTTTVLSILCISLISIIIVSNLLYKKLQIYRYKGFIGLVIFSFFFVFGGLLCLLNKEKFRPDYFANKNYTTLKICVNDEPQLTHDILRFKARVVAGYENGKQIKLSGKLLLALKLDSLAPIHLRYGDEVVISAKYLEVESSYNPAEFDFKAWLASQNIYHQAFINQNHIYKTNNNDGNPIIKFALHLRENQIAKYRQLIKDDEAYAVASTLILGYRADLSKETLAAYSKTGTIHALSVSGSHVAIIFFVLDYLLIFLNKRRSLQIMKFILICGLIWMYALITGLSPSVVRASIMIVIFITAKTFAKNKNSYNILAFAAFCQLIYNPFLILDVGYQLSYISVFGLIYLQPKIYSWLYIGNNLVDRIWQLIALSISAQIVTFPLCIYYFHQFPVYFLLGNLFISIPLMIIMVLGIGILFPLIDRVAPIFEWVMVFTNKSLKWIADLPYSTFSSIWINIPEFILLSLALSFSILALDRKNKKFVFIAFTLFIAYQSLAIFDELKADHQKKIIFYTLRKNYAVAFINGNKAIIETDLNPSENNYLFFIQPSLDQAQIKDIAILNIDQDTVLSNFIKKDNQIVYFNKSFLIIDEKFNYKNLQSKSNFDAIWLQRSTKFDLNKLDNQIAYKNIIVDGTNKDYKIKQFKNFADNNRYPIHILKKNAAYLIDLNP